MISRRKFDNYDGRDVYVYTIESNELAVEVCDFGAAVRAVRVKAKENCDVSLGFNSVSDYVNSRTYCGATVGRVANRIKSGKFTLNDKAYSLGLNDGANCNHSGFNGYDTRFFAANIKDDNTLALSIVSPDGDQGFPGELLLNVEFKVQGSALGIRFTASSDKDTYFAPTCHAYFNLNGEGSGCAMDTLLSINAEHFTPLDAEHIPTGELMAVHGTPFDFRSEKPLARDIATNDNQLADARGYDHNFVLMGHPSAIARSPKTGITLTVDTDFPGLQLYTANFMDGCMGKTSRYYARDAFCLEAQFFPNSVNIPSFPSPLIKAGQTRENYIKYDFSVRSDIT